MKPLNVIIGRFQVPMLSQAHKEVIFTAAKSEYIILVGVSPLDKRDHRHPLSFRQRAKMIEDYQTNSTTSRWLYKGVFPIFDSHSDRAWSDQVDKFLESIYPERDYLLMGGRDSFIPHYNGKYKTLSIPEKLKHQTGTEIRKNILEDVSSDFRAGQIYAIENQFPRVMPTVDIGVLSMNEGIGLDSHRILLIQRADTREWCLPGGFVDPKDQSFLGAAQRELSEEVGIDLAVTGWSQVGTYPIGDWRYRQSRDRIITSLFRTYHQWGAPNISKEVSASRWLVEREALHCVAPHHQVLVSEVFRCLNSGK